MLFGSCLETNLTFFFGFPTMDSTWYVGLMDSGQQGLERTYEDRRRREVLDVAITSGSKSEGSCHGLATRTIAGMVELATSYRLYIE